MAISWPISALFCLFLFSLPSTAHPKPPLAVVLTMDPYEERGNSTLHLLQEIFEEVYVVYPPRMGDTYSKKVHSNLRGHIQAMVLGMLLMEQGLGDWVWIFEDDVAVSSPLSPANASSMILEFNNDYSNYLQQPFYTHDVIYGGGCIPGGWKRCWVCLHAYAIHLPDNYDFGALDMYPEVLDFMYSHYPILLKGNRTRGRKVMEYNASTTPLTTPAQRLPPAPQTNGSFPLPPNPTKGENTLFSSHFAPTNFFPPLLEIAIKRVRSQSKEPLDSAIGHTCEEKTKLSPPKPQLLMLGRNLHGRQHPGLFRQDRGKFKSTITKGS